MIFYLDILSMFCVLPTYLCPVAGLGAGLVPTEGVGRAEDRQVVAFTARRGSESGQSGGNCQQ